MVNDMLNWFWNHMQDLINICLCIWIFTINHRVGRLERDTS